VVFESTISPQVYLMCFFHCRKLYIDKTK